MKKLSLFVVFLALSATCFATEYKVFDDKSAGKVFVFELVDDAEKLICTLDYSDFWHWKTAGTALYFVNLERSVCKFSFKTCRFENLNIKTSSVIEVSPDEKFLCVREAYGTFPSTVEFPVFYDMNACKPIPVKNFSKDFLDDLGGCVLDISFDAEKNGFTVKYCGDSSIPEMSGVILADDFSWHPDRIVQTTDRLRVRTEPTLTASTIKIIPKEAWMKVLKTGDEVTIDGIAGHWVYVYVFKHLAGGDTDAHIPNEVPESVEGWCFDGYLKQQIPLDNE